jgi:hypothetical protein
MENSTDTTYFNQGGLGELTKALINVQRSVQGATANKTNPHLKNKYADLGSVWSTCRDLLADNGLAVTHVFRESTNGETVTCVAMLLHVSGQSITSTLTLRPGKNTPQEMGSAITYARRYTLASLVGIVVDDDDDGNAATRKEQNAPKGIEARKAEVKAALKAYKGADKDELVGACQIAAETGNFDNKFADDILKKVGITIVNGRG